MSDTYLELEFTGELWYWRGPSPYHFVTVPEEPSVAIRALAPIVTYGWGMVPVTARIGASEWTTALTPKDGRYLLPIRDAVRVAEHLAVGDSVDAWLAVRS